MCSQHLLAAWLLLSPVTYALAEKIQYQHVLSFPYEPVYPANFRHFDYVNPDAPKGGLLRLAVGGTWDSFNHFIHKGRPAAGMALLGAEDLFYDRLMTRAADEPTARYGLLAEGAAVAPDGSWVAFRLRNDATWHDGEPITVRDVVFSFNTFKEVGSVTLKSLLTDVDTISVTGPNEIRYAMREGAERNPNLPLVLADLPVLPQHYWQTRNPALTTV